MKIYQLLFPITFLLSFCAISQETITYPHCNCIDIIDELLPTPNGVYTRICDDVVIEKGEFKTGLKTGLWISYSSNGDIIKTINYSDGRLNGDFSYFYNNGKKKLNGSFSNDLKKGDWNFYNQKGKIQWSQSYNAGKPIGRSLIYNQKGKKVVVSYDFDTEEYIVNDSEFSIFEEAAEILQDPSSSGWFILLQSDPTAKTKELLLDQNNIESELFMSLIEIPVEVFDTYLNVNYNAELTFENSALQSIELKREAANGDEYPLFAFTAMTNDPDQLTRLEPSEFTLTILDSKIKEALAIFTPWQIEEGKFNMAFIYVINEIGGREEIDGY